MCIMSDANVLTLRRYSACAHREIQNTLILFCFGVTFFLFSLYSEITFGVISNIVVFVVLLYHHCSYSVLQVF